MTTDDSEFFLDSPWKDIDEPCYPKGRRLYMNDDRIWVSMDDDRQMLFFIQEDGVENVKPLENIDGLKVTIDQYGAGKRLVCRLTAHDPEVVEKFSIVAKDIAFHCRAYSGSQLFLKVQIRIKSWANFLKPSRVGLPHSELLGLLGELYLLAEEFIPALNPSDAIKAWKGPEGAKQDFTFEQSAFEIKATLSGEKQTVRISSLDQLDKVTENLYLVRLVASESGDVNGFTLQNLYEKCLSSMSNNIISEGMFLQKVSGLYGKASESQLNDHYMIVNLSIYRVADNFPKLTSRMVHLAITNVQYELALSALSEFEVDKTIEELLLNG